MINRFLRSILLVGAKVNSYNFKVKYDAHV